MQRKKRALALVAAVLTVGALLFGTHSVTHADPTPTPTPNIPNGVGPGGHGG